MHIVEISPEEAVIAEESEYTESVVSERELCGHCGQDYCDDDTCPCGEAAESNDNRTEDEPSRTADDDDEEESEDEEETIEAARDDNYLGGAEFDRSDDVAEWVTKVRPEYDDHDNANNNNNENNNNNDGRSLKSEGGKRELSPDGGDGRLKI